MDLGTRQETALNLHYPLRFYYRRLPGRPALGADGLVRAVDSLAPALDIHGARVLSGVAFRTYQLTPDDNHAYATEFGRSPWRWATLAMENYGVLESLSTHLDRELRLYPSMRPIDALALARFEFDSGRNVFGRLRHRGGEFVALVAIETGKERYDAPSGGDADFMIESTDAKRFPDGPEIADAMLVARPQPEPIPDRRRAVLERDVLEFASRHAESKKELSFGEELFYASGHRALQVTSDLIRAVEPSEDWAAYWAAWSNDLREARASAAEFFAGAVSLAYWHVADGIPQVPDGFDWADPTARRHLAESLAELIRFEERALAALAESIGSVGQEH